MLMCHLGKTLYIEDVATRVRDGLAEETLGILLETCLYLGIIPIRIDEGALYAELLHGYAEEVEGAAIDGVGGDEVVACLTDIEHSIEIGCLTRTGEHSPYSTLEGADFLGYGIIGRISKTGIEISFILQVEETRHLVAGLIPECG